MRRSLFTLVFAAAPLFACSSSDPGAQPDGDAGVGVDAAITDARGNDSGRDTSSTDTATSDTSAGDTTPTDAPPDVLDSSTTDAPTESPADSPVTDVSVDGATPCDALAHDCPTGSYCDAPACGLGTCKTAPASPSLALDPVCACTGVTFWNAEQAQAAGESYASAPGACDVAATTTHHCGGSLATSCSGSDACIADHSSVGRCPAPTVGSSCWRIPSGVTCPASDPKTYRDCGDSACHSYCEVLLSTDAFYGDASCP